MKSMEALFMRCIEEVYDAERQIVLALPKLVAASETPELKEAFELHLKETETHLDRLDSIFQMIEAKPHHRSCEPVRDLFESSMALLKEGGEPSLIEAGLIAEAQSVEHYEIARYGTLLAWATQLGYDEILPLLQATLDEEKAADRKLTNIAERRINRAAA